MSLRVRPKKKKKKLCQRKINFSCVNIQTRTSIAEGGCEGKGGVVVNYKKYLKQKPKNCKKKN